MPRRIVFPEAHDRRVVEAAKKLRDENLVKPVLVDNQGVLRGDRDLAGIEVIRHEEGSKLSERYAAILQEAQAHKGMTIEKACKACESDLVFGSLAIRAGDVHGGVAGSFATTGDVLRAGIQCIGLQPGMKTVSSCFLMALPDGRNLTMGDCGVVIDPTEAEIVDIAVATAASHKLLTGEEPRVALLSFSTKGSASHPRQQKMANATAALHKRAPNLMCDGELQGDAALIPSIQKSKAPHSRLGGEPANVLIFPDLDSGNISYKLTQRLTGATALGPLVQGLNRPLLDLSRGCSVGDIVLVGCIASIFGAN